MKKTSVLYGILLAIIIFWFSLLTYDTKLLLDFASYNISDDYTVFYFNSDTDILKDEEFFNDFTRLIENNKVSVYQGYDDNISFFTYALSSNQVYLDSLVFKDDPPKNLIDFKEYRNSFSDPNGKLYDPIVESDLRIIPLKDSFNDPLFHVEGTYIIDNRDVDALDMVLDDLLDKYEDVTVETMKFTPGDDVTEPLELTDYIVLGLIVSSYVILLFINIIRNSKKNSLCKQEGYSNIALYYDTVIKYIIFTFISTFIFLLLLIVTFIPLYALRWSFVLDVLVYLLFTNITFFILSIITYYLIMLVPINMYVKGKNYLARIGDALRITKSFLVIFSFTLIIFMFTFIETSFHNIVHLQEFNEKYESLYSVHMFRTIYSSDLNNEEGLTNLDAYLAENAGSFRFDKMFTGYGVNYDDFDKSSTLGSLFEADYNYAKKAGFYKIFDEDNLLEEVLVVDESFDMSLCVNLNYCKTEVIRINYDEYELINYQYYINYDSTGLGKIHNKEIGKNDVIYIRDLTGNPYSKLFYHDSNLESAQEFINSTAASFGVGPVYVISSLYEDNHALIKYYNSESYKPLINASLVIINFILLSSQFIIVSLEKNKTKKYLMVSEGYSLFQLIKTDLLENVVDYLFCILFMYFIFKFNILSVLGVILFWFIIDLLLYMVIVRRTMYEN